MSLNHWITVVVAQKVGTVPTAAELFRHCASDAGLEALRAFLRAAPDLPSEPGDEAAGASWRRSLEGCER